MRKAYREKLLRLHPDKNPEADRSAYDRLTLAYEVLRDPESRVCYDEATFFGK